MTDHTPTRLLIAWTTDLNSTRRMAQKVVAGARSVDGVDVRDLCLETGTEIGSEELATFDALILGTPVRHRNMHHRVKRFIEHTLEIAWLDDACVGMVGATFCVGGGHGDAGAGAELCQLGMLAAMAASGLIPVPLPKCTPGADHAGLHWGPVGRAHGPKMTPLWPSPPMLECGYHHGANVARLAKIVSPHRGTVFATGNVSPPTKLAEAFSMGGPSEVPAANANPAHRTEAPEMWVSGKPMSGQDGGQKGPLRDQAP